MAKATIETERKYDVASNFVVPPLDLAVDGAPLRVIEADALLELEALYFDTDDLRLSSQGVSLRRRVGGHDSGWHLKLPSGTEHTRVELQQRLGASGDGVPAEFLDLTFAWTRGAPLIPVARLRTARCARRLLDGDGTLLAEIDDDQVTAERLGEGAELQWREIEVESRPAGQRLVPRIEKLLVNAGARGSDGDPKVVRVLRGDPRGRWSDRLAHVDAVTARLRAQAEELLVRDTEVRREVPDSVHQMRVSLRRLRGCLRTFRPLFDRDEADGLRRELGWLAGVLGAVRDAEVLRQRVRAHLGELPVGHLLGPIRASLGDELLGVELAARAQACQALKSDRYARLLDRLAAFVERPPFEKAPTRSRLRALAADELSRSDRAAAFAASLKGARREVALHELRKTAKRARYGAETLVSSEGAPARRLAEVYAELQSVLGERHDAFVLVELLRAEGARAGVRPGENGYTYGVLVGLELARLSGSDAAIDRAVRRTSRGTGRAFLT